MSDVGSRNFRVSACQGFSVSPSQRFRFEPFWYFNTEQRGGRSFGRAV
jgi:hypothetical protein